MKEIRRHVPADTRHTAGLYDVMLDYPLRPAKALRPALLMATCRALGGSVDAALPSAAALEMFHNACLVHDDVEDTASRRRHAPALHVTHGVPIAVNVGDGMLVVSLSPLLDNTRVLGVGPALRVIAVFSRMARESVEGQMLELEWARSTRWDLQDREYLRMVHKKTGWYSFVAPIQIGCIAANADQTLRERMGRFALCLGVAFQIQDDLLGLESSEATLGKDALGDLWEGKYTLPLLSALRTLPPARRREAILLLKRPRPPLRAIASEESALRDGLLRKLTASTELTEAERCLLEEALGGARGRYRTEADVERLRELVMERDGANLDHARRVARRFSRRASRLFDRDIATLPESVHKRFLRELITYVTRRTH